MKYLVNYSKFFESASNSNYEIKSFKYWRKVVETSPYTLKILDTIEHKQNGMATARQMAVLRKIERGDTSPWHPKN